jgi:diguanylate cyclase (GGDEF)-like protein
VSGDLSSSLYALLLQAIGIVPLAVLSFLLSRTIRQDYLRYFWQAWTSLALALLALYLSQRLPGVRLLLEPFYFLGEYLFAGFLIAGCRNLATSARLTRDHLWFLVPAVLVAVTLPLVPAPFTVRFIPQAAILAVLFATARGHVHRVPAAGQGRIGVPLLKLSLLALVVSFLHYVPVLSWAAWTGHVLPPAYAAYTSLFDLLLETLLGFGTLIVVMEREHAELETVNLRLRSAREELEALARLDPLTESLNRHAFYSMVEGDRRDVGASGCVAVLDLDALKPVNDTFGHAAGDAAIRAVAGAVRQLVRADDLVFRWGGDEFLVVLFNVTEDEARRRLGGLEGMLGKVPVPGSPEPVALTASLGVAAFGKVKELERAIETADERMYRTKLARRVRAQAGPPTRSGAS